jgi:hypothetical protein
MVELRTWLPTSAGNMQRVLVIDVERALVKEQHVYDPSGKTLIASAVAHSHRYHPVEQVSLPDRLTVRLPPAQIAFSIDMGPVEINRLTADSQQLWALPLFEGCRQFDLGTAPASQPVVRPGGITSVDSSSPGGDLRPQTIEVANRRTLLGRLRSRWLQRLGAGDHGGIVQPVRLDVGQGLR